MNARLKKRRLARHRYACVDIDLWVSGPALFVAVEGCAWSASWPLFIYLAFVTLWYRLTVGLSDGLQRIPTDNYRPVRLCRSRQPVPQ